MIAFALAHDHWSTRACFTNLESGIASVQCYLDKRVFTWLWPYISDIQPPIFTPAFTKDATAQIKHRHTLPQRSRESYMYVD